ncbi:glucokinase [Massilia forsythiae]|uniref:Glucokinase n=1 Tax=Massilia forsythiae TaxID=2728020 RepID=A0A7Z2W1K7_9BURK|nr:glucokinase [Massilia forsythiae]QJE02782.1 glucokinase [Massilia forsythiae]
MIATSHQHGGARLLADIGGTNARFALERGPGRIEDIATLPCANHPRLVDAVRAYLGARAGADRVRHAVIAIANPVEGDFVKMTNHHWEFSIRQAREELGLDTLLVVNDFAALAMSVPELPASDLMQVGGTLVPADEAGKADGVIGLVGAGTGLGVAGLIPAHGRWTVLQSEGGHVAFSPSNAREQDILAWCWQRYPHVSAERLVSGPGLSLIHEALSALAGAPAAPLDPAVVVERALEDNDPLCTQVLEIFCGMLGTVAANVAVTLCARGGIYIGGGVVPRLGDWFARSPFRAHFENKGRFSAFAARIPCFVIRAPYPALAGAAAMLEQHLADAGAAAGAGARDGTAPQHANGHAVLAGTEARHAHA